MNLAEMLASADTIAQEVETNSPSKEFELIEPGTYDVAVTGASGPHPSKVTNPTNPNEHGQYLKIECTITGPKFSGRKIWMNNNIICFPRDLSEENVRKSQMAISIGAKERKVMLDSIGKKGIQMAEELVGASFSAVVATEKGTNGYKDKSVIRSVKPIGSASTTRNTPVTAAATSVEQSSPTTRAKMPWEK